MFQGEYTNNMDDKGRVNIPAPFRDVLLKSYNESTIVVSRDPQTLCLRAYPLREWKRLLAKLGQRPSNDKVALAYKRAVVSSAQTYNPDKQGRILVPQTLRQYAGIQKSTVFAGMAEFFEIWDADAREQEFKAALAFLKDQELDF